jgi:hypothetical protein
MSGFTATGATLRRARSVAKRNGAAITRPAGAA